MNATSREDDTMENNDTATLRYTIARRIAVMAAVFAVILSVLLIVNYVQTKAADPLNSAALQQLMEKLRETPGDETLKEQIRALDLLARKAYFVNRWQIRAGGFLLFFFVLTFLVALKYMHSFHPSFPDLTRKPTAGNLWEERLLARRYLLFGGLGLFTIAFVLGAMTENSLEDTGIDMRESPAEPPSYPDLAEIRENWPGFRGPEGIGHTYTDSAPTRWDTPSGENVLWKATLPLPGFNSPIVWGDKLFLSGSDGETQAVFCFDTDSGEVLWRTDLDDISGSPGENPDVSEDTGFAAPTMATDGSRVFVLFGTGDCACLDFEGKRLWAKNLGVPENHYGHSSSPIIYRHLLLIQYDQNSGGHLIALDTQTGKLVYDQHRDIDISWASPILVTVDGHDEIILNSSPGVIAHDPATGRELWRADCMSGEVAPSPAYADGIVFVVNDYAKLAAIRPGDPAEILWESEDDLSEVSSPLATDEFVFVATSYGTVSCFDAKTGERYWYEDLPRGFYSSPVLAGENVYVMDLTGAMYIFRAAKTYEPVGVCELGEEAFAVPAFVRGRIYIRGKDTLYCIGG